MTPGCEKIAGTDVEGRRVDEGRLGIGEKETEGRAVNGRFAVEGCNDVALLGRCGPKFGVETPAEVPLVSRSSPASALSPSGSSSLSESVSKGSSLSTFIAAATQRSAILVTECSFARSNR